MSQKDVKRFRHDAGDGRGRYALLQLRKTGSNDRREDRPNMFYPILAPNGEEVYPRGPSGYQSCWRVEKRTLAKINEDDLIVWQQRIDDDDAEPDDLELEEDDDSSDAPVVQDSVAAVEPMSRSLWVPYVKYYLTGRTKRPSNLWKEIEGNKKGSLVMRDLFGAKVFDNPKPVEFLAVAMDIATGDDDLILDFFAGAGTTAQAVLEKNVAGGSRRQFILVQLDEAMDPANTRQRPSLDFCASIGKPGNVAEICKERIRRVIKKLESEHDELFRAIKQTGLEFAGTSVPAEPINLGFKVLKIKESQFKRWSDFEGEDIPHIRPASTRPPTTRFALAGWPRPY